MAHSVKVTSTKQHMSYGLVNIRIKMYCVYQQYLVFELLTVPTNVFQMGSNVRGPEIPQRYTGVYVNKTKLKGGRQK